MLKKDQINTLFARLSADNPEPVTELVAPNPFCLLVAIICSAQATDAGVNKATPALFAVADTPAKMVEIGESEIRNHLKTIGLFNSKAKNVYAMSQMLLSQHGGQVPHTREELMELPGVGRKTANVWLNCVLGELTMAVDTHVQRVSNRLGLCKTQTPEQTEPALLKKIPKKWMLHAHHWLILLGRYTCKARKPECGKCLVVDICAFKGKVI